MILTPLMPHQQDALAYLEDRKECALFMKYGCGKSLIALAHADRLKANLVLITSDKTNATDTWVEQIETHTDFRCVVRPRDCPKDLNEVWDLGAGPLCVLVNYDLLPSVSEFYASLPFTLWIGDESSDFKDTRTDRFYHLNKVVKNIPNKIILNGDPMTERPEDLFGQFKVLDGGRSLGTSLTEFRRRHMQLDPLGYRWCLKRSAMTHIHEAIKDVSYWHDGAGVVMPKRRYHVVHVDKTSDQERLDDELKQWFAAEFKNKKIEVQYAAVLFIKRIQLMGGIFRPSVGDDGEQASPIIVPTNKYPILKELLDRNLDKKIVVWHEYVPETDLISSKLKCDGYDHWIYDDSSNLTPLHQFQAAPNGVLLIRNSFCKGLNTLADGDIAVVWSNPLSYRDRSQMLGRTCRMSSKTHETHVVDIITRGGADEIVYGMLNQKRSLCLTLSQLRSMVAPQ